MGNEIGQQRTGSKKRGRPAKHGVYSAIRGGQIPPEHAAVVAQVDAEIAQFTREIGGGAAISALDRVLLATLRGALLVCKLVGREVEAHGLPAASLLDTWIAHANAVRRIVRDLNAAHPPGVGESINEVIRKYKCAGQEPRDA